MNAELKAALAEASAAWRRELHASCPKCSRMAEALESRINAAQVNRKGEALEALQELQQFIERE